MQKDNGVVTRIMSMDRLIIIMGMFRDLVEVTLISWKVPSKFCKFIIFWYIIIISVNNFFFLAQ